MLLGQIILTLLALAFIFYGLLRKRQIQSPTLVSAQTAFYRQRLQELEQDRELGLIDDQQFKELQLELERQLLAETPDAAVSTGRSQMAGTVLAVAIALVFVIASFWLYERIGARHELQLYNLQQQLAEKPGLQASDLHELQAVAERALSRRPDSVDLLMLLPRLHMQLGEYAVAADYYARLDRELPDHAGVLAQWAQALYLADQRELSPRVRELLERSLALEPEQSTALGMLGIEAFSRGDYLQAINHWQRLLRVLPAESGERATISDALQRARAAAQDQGLLDGLALEIDLDPRWREQASGILFVFALAADGSGMPVAVQRLSLRDVSWPLKVTLTDMDAMTPERQLSHFDEVRVVARISRHGSVSPRSGDLQGELEPPVLWREADSLQITIDQRID